MSTIVAIWWWESGRPWYEWETKAIDQKIVELSWKMQPRFLFVGTAMSDHEWYIEGMKRNYTELWCSVDHLPLEKQELSRQEIKDRIAWADIIYVWWGDTQHMMDVRKKDNVDILLKEAYTQDKVLCGLSAGSICWFDAGQSDKEKFADGKISFAEVKWLWCIPAIHTPHFNIEAWRYTSWPQCVENYGGVGIALENNCAMVVKNDRFMLIASKETARGFECKVVDGKYVETEIPQGVWLDLW